MKKRKTRELSRLKDSLKIPTFLGVLIAVFLVGLGVYGVRAATTLRTSTTLRIKAVSSSNANTPVVGATFQVNKTDGGEWTVTTDNSGYATIPGMTAGSYTIKQTNAPAGYMSNPQSQTITIARLGVNQGYREYHDVTISNAEANRNNTTIRLKVVDTTDSTKRVPNASFLVKKEGGGQWMLTSDSNGYAQLTGMTAGKYTITQISSPDGYMAMPASKEFEIPESNPVRYPEYADVTVFNTPYDQTSRGVLYINVQQENTPSNRIANVSLKVTDDLGNVYIGATDTNGQLAIKGLSTARTYHVETLSIPYNYDYPRTDVGDVRLNLIGASNTVTVHLPLSEQVEFRIDNYEKGDNSIKLTGSTYELFFEDGTSEIITTTNGSFTRMLPQNKKYILKQLTSDNDHIIYGESFTFSLTRSLELKVPNALKNPETSKVTVRFSKQWVDTPSTVQTATFYLYKNGERYGNAVTIKSNATNKSHTFTDLPKYNDNHEVINWTVKEEAISGWYATYDETSENNWTIKNYEGELTGSCKADGKPFMYVSAVNSAYLLKNGQEVVHAVNFPSQTTSGSVGNYGHAISYSRKNGYLYGIDRTGELVVMNPNQGANGTVIKRIQLGGIVEKAAASRLTYGSYSSYIHPNWRKVTTGEIDPTGEYLFVKVNGDPYFYIYKTADIEKAETTDGATVTPVKIIDAYHKANTSRWAHNTWWPLSDGDVIIKDNGDLIYSGHEVQFPGTALSNPKTNQSNYFFYYMKYTGPWKNGKPDLANGTWSAPQKAGYPAANTPAVNGSSYTRGGVNNYTDAGYGEFSVDGMTLVGGNVYITSEVWTTKTNRILRVAQIPEPNPSNPDARLNAVFLDTKYNFGVDNANGVNKLPINQLDDMTGAATEVCEPEIFIRGKKNWIGDSESDRPESIKVQLYADGVAVSGKELTLTAANNWSYAFTGLPKYRTNTTTRIVYSVKEVASTIPSGYVVTYDKMPTNNDTTYSNSFDITNTLITGGFSLKKTDGQNPLAGATFNLWQLNSSGQRDKLVATGTSATNTGLINFTGLRAGNYELEEVSAPEGYTATSTTYTVTGTINQTSKSIDFVVKNGNTTLTKDGNAYVVKNTKPTYKFKVVKIDGTTGEKITASSRFAITDVNGNVIRDQVATLNNGEFTFTEFEPGTYYLKEIEAPQGYVGLKDLVGFTLTAKGEVTITDGVSTSPMYAYGIDRTGRDTITLKVLNLQPKLRITKVSSDNTATVLSGAKFKLYRSDAITQIGSELTTDSQGIIEFNGITPGTYYLEESQTPEGYQTNAKKYKIIVSGTYQVTTDNGDELLTIGTAYGSPITMPITVANKAKPTTARFALSKRIKGIENTGTHGITTPVTFTLTKVGDTSFTPVVQTKPFKENFIFDNLTVGTYLLEETQAPAGYVKTGERYVVVVDTDTTVRVFKVSESVATSPVTDATLNKSANLESSVAGQNREILDGNDTTYTRFNLPAGLVADTTIGLDLGKMVKVTEVKFYQGSSANGANRMADAILEYSTDGVTYTELKRYQNQNDIIEDLSATPIYARYVRFRNGTYNHTWLDVRTLQVSGTELENLKTLIPDQQGQATNENNLVLIGNIQNPSLNLQKVDRAGNVIARASRFKLYKVGDDLTTVTMDDIEETNFVQEFTLGDGQITAVNKASVLGKYALVETQAPTGYAGLTEPILLNLVEARQQHDGSLYKAVTRFEVLTQGDKVVVDTSRTNAENILVLKVSNSPSAYNLKILKRDYNNANTGLDARFELYNETGETLVPGMYGNTTQEGNSLLLPNLAPGTYVLKEVQVPTGYQKVKDIKFTITADGTIEILSNNAAYTSFVPAGNTTTIEFTVKNLKKGEYPKTGGIGSLMFYATGILLMAIAGYAYKRRSH